MHRDLESTLRLVSCFLPLGADLVDVSSGGIVPGATVLSHERGWNVPLSKAIKQLQLPLTVGVAGGIRDAVFAEQLLSDQSADVLMIGRAFLLNSNLVFDWSRQLGSSLCLPTPYQRAQRLLE